MEYTNVTYDAITGETTEEVIQMTPEQIAEQQAILKSTIQNKNKDEAKQLLADTDWTTIADVGNPQISNPYLSNQAEFIAYRNEIRAIAINPPDTQIVFPTKPTEQWSTV